jgi:hypothetical protein
VRTRPTRERAESRLVSRYHKLHEPLIELVQALEDVLPIGMQLGDTVDLITKGGELLIFDKPRPARVVLHDKDHTFVLEISKARKRSG